LEINLIIRELLANNNFISLPGIGSFIQKYEPARPSSDGLSFIPPKQVIAFDPSRSFNDEAIENYLSEKNGISHSEASSILTEFVNSINSALNQGKPFSFENIGTLSKDSTGKYQFEQAISAHAAIDTYGLNEVSVSKTNDQVKIVQPLATKEHTKPKESSTSKVAIILSSIVGIAAIVTVFILIPDLRFWESAIKNDNTTVILKDSSNNSIALQNQVIAAIDSSLTKKDTIISKVEKEIANNNVKKTALSYEEPKKLDSKMYYLIVGSFGKLENAQKLSDIYTQRGFKTEIIQGVNMYRVSISQFSDKNIAIAEFNKFHSQNPNESIWLLGQ